MLRKIPALLLSIVLVAMPATSAVMAQASDHAASWAVTLRQAESRGHRRIELRLLDGRRVKGNLVVLHPDTCFKMVGIASRSRTGRSRQQNGRTMPSAAQRNIL